LVTTFADAELAPFSYVVDDVSLMVTFSPADVSSPKPEVDTLLTVPIDPPAAGPDRALDPPPPDPAAAFCAAVVEEEEVEEVVSVVELDVPPQAESPIAGTNRHAVAQRRLRCVERGLRLVIGMKVRLPSALVYVHTDRPDN
jgi:hypothetical protein